jgi:hypothetical protein
MVKRLLIGSRYERYARRLWAALTNAPESQSITEGDLRDARDTAYVRAMLRTLPHDACCVDIGAHKGAFLRLFKEFCPKGDHLAFEAIPTLAQQLSPTFPDVRVHNCALSDHAGHADFQYVPQLPGWSGLRAQPYPILVSPETIRVELNRTGIIGERLV